MTVYVDNAFIRATVRNNRYRHTSRWCHLMCDGDDAELVAFAERIGLQARWIQDAGTERGHFDVTEPKRHAAVKAGAVEISWHDLAALMDARRAGTRFTPPGQLALEDR